MRETQYKWEFLRNMSRFGFESLDEEMSEELTRLRGWVKERFDTPDFMFDAFDTSNEGQVSIDEWLMGLPLQLQWYHKRPVSVTTWVQP